MEGYEIGTTLYLFNRYTPASVKNNYNYNNKNAMILMKRISIFGGLKFASLAP